MNLTEVQMTKVLTSLKKKPEQYLYLKKASKHNVDNTIGVCPKEINAKKHLLYFDDKTNTIYELPKSYSQYDKLPTKVIPKSGAFFYKVPLSDFKVLQKITTDIIENTIENTIKNNIETKKEEKKEENSSNIPFNISKTIHNLPINSNTHIDNILKLMELDNNNSLTKNLSVVDKANAAITAYINIINVVRDI